MNTQTIAYFNEVWTQILAVIFPTLHLPTVHLFTNTPTLQPTMQPGDFTEAVFTGYSPVTISGFIAPTFPANGQAQAYPTDVVTFTSTGTGTDTVNGYFIKDNAGFLVSAEYFPNPVPFTATGDTVSFLPGFGIGPGLNSAVIVP